MKSKRRLFWLFASACSVLSSLDSFGEEKRKPHAVHLGYPMHEGAGGKNVFEGSLNLPLSLGYSYTARSGSVYGLFYEPGTLLGVGSLFVQSSVLGLYSGLQLDNNLVFTGGLNVCFTSVSDGISSRGGGIGANLGAGYRVKNAMVGIRFSSYDFHIYDYDAIPGWPEWPKGKSFGFELGFLF